MRLGPGASQGADGQRRAIPLPSPAGLPGSGGGEERFDHQRMAYRSPQEIAYIESFHGKLEVEEIYQREYGDPLEAQSSIGAWLEEYNTVRPHQGLNYRTPQEVYLEGAEELRRSGGAN